MIERERKVDLEKMNESQLSTLEKEMAKKLESILVNAAKEANQFLNIYGIQIKIAYELQQKEEVA